MKILLANRKIKGNSSLQIAHFVSANARKMVNLRIEKDKIIKEIII